MPKDPRDDVYECDIVINGSSYSLTLLDKTMSPSSAEFIKGYRLEKNDSKRPGVYDVIQTVHGFECDCADYRIRRAGADSLGCKHMRAMFALGFLERAAHKPAPVVASTPSQPGRTSPKNVFPG